MKRSELIERTDTVVNETKAALQTVYDALNHGQRMQIVKVGAVKKLFERYGVEVG